MHTDTHTKTVNAPTCAATAHQATPEASPGKAGAPARPARRPGTANPYLHGKGYAIRRQYQGHAIFLSGFKTQAEARRAMNREVLAIDNRSKPAGAGAQRTSLAQALQDYALEHLPFLKGAPQEARRINSYLRAAGLRLLKVSQSTGERGENPKTGRGSHYEVELVAHTAERVIPPGLGEHRKALLNANARTDKHRAVLARTAMADISRQGLQQFVCAMRRDRHSPATIGLERALLRSLFNHAFTVWKWHELQDNPATRLKMPKVDNKRRRVLGIQEQTLLEQALADCRNERIEPALTLLRETAMRASEPLEIATWADVDWQRNVLYLPDGKTGSRPVPLSPAAIEALHALRALGTGEADERIVGITYESLRAAWRRACARAGIENLRIHDLRRTAATRTTILNFRHLLERHGLSARLLAAVNRHLQGKGLLLRQGTIVDATIIDAPSSTKNRSGTRDPEMHQTKKGNQWFFGMKAHIGVDRDSGLVHTVVATAAKVADVTQTDKLLHGKEKAVFADAGYTGADKREELKGKRVDWNIAERRSRIKALPEGELKDVSERLEHLIAKVRSKVEHPFRVVKRQFGHTKVRYRGLAKNAGQLNVLFALSNLWMARRRLLAMTGKVRLQAGKKRGLQAV